jgi:hypothetical protein
MESEALFGARNDNEGSELPRMAVCGELLESGRRAGVR